MRTPFLVPAALAILLFGASPAGAWNPDEDDQPDVAGPAEAPVEIDRPTAADRPDGVYLVTETYVDDVVTHSGAVTVYGTETVHEITGSYARVLESVGTGSRSDFDGSAFNGRATLSDGRAVAGTYYENYVRTGDGFTAVSIVFFQDDLEVARSAVPAVRSAPDPSTTSGAGPAAPATGSVAPAVDAPATGWVAPVVEAPNEPSLTPETRERQEPVVVPGAPGAALAPDRSIEVLRGRRIAITFGGAGVTRWRFAGGEGILLGPTSGDGAWPFVARWDRLAPAGGAWIARFVLGLSDGSELELALRVTVRAPGLVE